jgi:hypothetical protein
MEKITVAKINKAIREKLIKPNEISDGSHTIGELYSHRIVLFIALCKELYGNAEYQTGQKSQIWKSLCYSSGDNLQDGWFLMGIGNEEGEQITYHLPSYYWSKVDFVEVLDKAPKFDGHKPNDVLKRILEL